MKIRPHPAVAKILTGIAGAALLVLILLAYLRPAFVVDLTSRFFLCS